MRRDINWTFWVSRHWRLFYAFLPLEISHSWPECARCFTILSFSIPRFCKQTETLSSSCCIAVLLGEGTRFPWRQLNASGADISQKWWHSAMELIKAVILIQSHDSLRYAKQCKTIYQLYSLSVYFESFNRIAKKRLPKSKWDPNRKGIHDFTIKAVPPLWSLQNLQNPPAEMSTDKTAPKALSPKKSITALNRSKSHIGT